LINLSQDQDLWVRYAVATNEYAPKKAIFNLLADSEGSVREAAQRHKHAKDMVAFF